MFLVSKLIDFLLLSPLLILILMMSGTVQAGRGLRGRALALLIPACVLFYVLSISPVADLLGAPLEQYHPYPQLASLDCDLILVLGGGKTAAGPPGPLVAIPNDRGRSRCLMGYRVWKQTQAPLLVTGGDPLRSGPPTEGEAMAAFLEMLDVPNKSIFIESSSRNTRENATYTKEIMASNGWTRACLVTSALHMPRSAAIFRRLGMDVTPVPCDYQAVPRNYRVWDFLPSANVLRESFAALHEYVGLAYYWARGWI